MSGHGWLVLFLFFLFFIDGCKKPEDIGLEVLPPRDLIYTDYSDAAVINSSTVKEDSLRADELSRILFGSIKEDTFGLVNSSWYGQVLLSSTPNLISDSSGLFGADSLVLSLGYAGWYGDTNALQSIHVYQVIENMYLDSNYYSNKTFTDSTIDLAYTATPQSFFPNSPVVVDTDTVGAQLRIRLSDALRDTLFNLNGRTEFSSNTNWTSYFKGIHISVDPASSGGAVYYFSPTSTYTRMTLYYHQQDTVKKSYSFTLSGGARVNHIDHDYTNSWVSDSASHDTINFVQALSGVKTLISFPDLKHFTDSGSILLNRAELVIKVPSGTTSLYAPPSDLLLAMQKESGVLAFPIDYYEAGFGGSYNSSTSSYTFAVTRQLQAILNGTTTDTLFSLSVLGSMVQANRLLVGSGKNSSSQMKLKLYYTKLP